TRAVLQHTVDLLDEGIGDLDVDVGVLRHPVQRDAGQREGVGVAGVDGVQPVLRPTDLDAVQTQLSGVVGLDGSGHGGHSQIGVDEGVHVHRSSGFPSGTIRAVVYWNSG